MRISRITLRIAAAAATATCALVGGTPVSAAPATTANGTSPTWTLLDWGQRICATPNDPRILYYFVGFEGSWSKPITASYTGLPAGTRVDGPLIAQPGSGDGQHVQIWATFRLGNAAVGAYVPKIWAADGTVTQSVPVTLEVRSHC